MIYMPELLFNPTKYAQEYFKDYKILPITIDWWHRKDATIIKMIDKEGNVYQRVIKFPLF